MINIILDIPNWTDKIQALAALVAVPLTIITLLKLISRDRDRASEIRSLSSIAKELSQLTKDHEKRHKASKKPHVGIEIITDIEQRRVRIDFKNSNFNTTIIDFHLMNDREDYQDFRVINSGITSHEGSQFF